MLIEFAAVPEDENSDENSDENPDEIMEFGESSAELTIDQSAATTQEIDPADYQVRVTAQSKSNGTISLHVTKAPEKEDPVEKARKDTEAKAEEAAKAAGFITNPETDPNPVPNLYGVNTSFRSLGVEGKEITYKSEEGIVQITCPVTKDHKKRILVTIGSVGGEYSGEISFGGDDENSKLDIVLEGLEDGLKETVTCYGDNEGDTPKVTKAGWENDEFKYEIRVESDDNSISLNEKDVETLIKAIMGSDETAKSDASDQS